MHRIGGKFGKGRHSILLSQSKEERKKPEKPNRKINFTIEEAMKNNPFRGHYS